MTAAGGAMPVPAAACEPLEIDAAFLDDPYPRYAALREAAALHWSPALFQGAWLVTRHADVDAALRSPQLSAQRTAAWIGRIDANGRRARAELDAMQRLFARALLFLDAPEHTRLRTVLAAGFHPQRIRALAPRIEALADTCLAALPATGRCDFMPAFARPFPSRVTCLLLGIDSAHQDDFIAWSDDLAAFISATQPDIELARRAQRSLLALKRCLATIIAARRHAPGDDLISLLLAAQAQGQVRGQVSGEADDDTELLAQCAMLLLAGHETTRNLLGNGLHALLRPPAPPSASSASSPPLPSPPWQALAAEPQHMGIAVRELLRYDSPVQYTARRAITDMLLCGQPVRRGELVVALIGSANRDPRRYHAPDRLDLSRREAVHLAFGRGPHMCIGAGLALMVADIAFTRLLRRHPHLTLAGTPRWNGNAALRGLASLPVAG